MLVLAVAMLTACQKQRYFSESAEIDSLKAGIAAYESGDWDTWRSQFADTCKVYHNSTEAASIDDVLKSHQEMLANFSNYGFDKNEGFYEMIVDDKEETWINYWGVWNGVFKANNDSIKVPVHLTARYVDGKVVKEYGYWDTGALVKTLEGIAAEAAKAVEATEEDAASSEE